MTYIILCIDKMPPVLTSESIIGRLANRVVPSGVAGVKVGVLRPRHVHFRVIIVLDTVRVDGIAGVDFICG